MELKEAYVQLTEAFDQSPDLYTKYNLLLMLREYVTRVIPETKLAIKEEPLPTTLAELKSYYVVDSLNNKYSVDEKGNLTKV